jgi:N6-adenosine-specific RNA methylase IME4
VGACEGLDVNSGRMLLKKWGYRRCEDIVWLKTNLEEKASGNVSRDSSTVLKPVKEHCLMGIKGTVRRASDAHIITTNIDTDVIVAEEPANGATKKPEELYRIIEVRNLIAAFVPHIFFHHQNLCSTFVRAGAALSFSVKITISVLVGSL